MKKVNLWLRIRKWQRRYRALLVEIGSDPFIRVEVHAKNLDEYCSRWLGVCALELTTPEWLVHSDPFVVLDAASRVASEDVAKVAQSTSVEIGKAWEKYWQCLVALRKCPPDLKKRAEDLQQSLIGFVEAVRVRKENGMKKS